MKKHFLLIILSSILLTSCFNNVSIYSKEHYTLPFKTKSNEFIFPLNTSVYLTSYNKQYENDENSIFSSFDNEIKKVHQDVDAYHSYDEVNGIYEINSSYGDENGIIISEELKFLLQESIRLSKLTNGSFNITLGELIDTWKPYFDKGETYQIKPNDDAIKEALNKSISSNELDKYLLFDDNSNKLIFKKYQDIDSIKLNLGAIAKGYALYKCKSVLPEGSFVLSAGSSSLLLIGGNPYSKDHSYSISITSPTLRNKNSTKESLFRIKAYEGESISTSGDYEKYFIDKNDGSICSHIINPHTGYSSSTYSLVNVISSCPPYVLDALSTSLMNKNNLNEAIDEIHSFEKAYEKRIDYCFVTRSFNNYKVYYSNEYKNRIINKSDKIIPMI